MKRVCNHKLRIKKPANPLLYRRLYTIFNRFIFKICILRPTVYIKTPKSKFLLAILDYRIFFFTTINYVHKHISRTFWYIPNIKVFDIIFCI